MPKINVVIPHQLPQAEAISRIKARLTKLNSEYRDTISEVKEKWNAHIGEFSFRAMGMQFSGTLTVEDNQVLFDGEVPLLVMLYKSEIEKKIRAEAKKILAAETAL